MHGVQSQDQGLVGPAAARLPWLCPSADALIALANDPIPLAKLSNDVGLVLLATRYVRSTSTPDTFRFSSLRESVVSEGASRLLETHTRSWLPAQHSVAKQLQLFSSRLSAITREFAEQRSTVNPEAAAAIGLLAPLGLWAAANINAEVVAAGLSELPGSEDSQVVQRKLWGLSQDEIARRLCSLWRLPDWIRATITTLSHSLGDAVRLGADVELAHIIREAVEQVDSEGRFTGWLKRSARSRTQLLNFNENAEVEEDPRTLRLLPQLLRTAARARRAGNEPRLRTAEDEVNRLHVLLGDVRDSFEIAVRDAKLSGLAELAAGAGHEINNPLAVISGNAQRLRKHETDGERQKSLDSIIRQSTRISDIVRELMHYARPTQPNRGRVDFVELAGMAVAAMQPQASVKGIHLRLEATEASHAHVDFGQVRKSLDALLQNAIEATPSGGDILVRVQTDADRTRIVVEDSGSGPTDAAVPHLFDPFYSGRPAGRGRGLGLATAWRLVSINGGDLQFHRTPDGPTRFTMIFPLAEKISSSLRIPA